MSESFRSRIFRKAKKWITPEMTAVIAAEAAKEIHTGSVTKQMASWSICPNRKLLKTYPPARPSRMPITVIP